MVVIDSSTRNAPVYRSLFRCDRKRSLIFSTGTVATTTSRLFCAAEPSSGRCGAPPPGGGRSRRAPCRSPKTPPGPRCGGPPPPPPRRAGGTSGSAGQVQAAGAALRRAPTATARPVRGHQRQRDQVAAAGVEHLERADPLRPQFLQPLLVAVDDLQLARCGERARGAEARGAARAAELQLFL